MVTLIVFIPPLRACSSAQGVSLWRFTHRSSSCSRKSSHTGTSLRHRCCLAEGLFPSLWGLDGRRWRKEKFRQTQVQNVYGARILFLIPLPLGLRAWTWTDHKVQPCLSCHHFRFALCRRISGAPTRAPSCGTAARSQTWPSLPSARSKRVKRCLRIKLNFKKVQTHAGMWTLCLGPISSFAVNNFRMWLDFRGNL